MKNAAPRFRTRRKLTSLCFIALIAIACTQASANTNLPPASDIQTAARDSGPIKDDQGRIRYIVDLIDDFSDKPASFVDAKSVIDYRTAKSAKLIDDVVNLQDIALRGKTSLVGTSFTAYLTPQQFDQFSKDIRVKLITQDAYLTPSAIWTSTTDATGQIRPWGLQAMGVASAGGSNGTATVYVLDTGVEMHADLPGLAAADRLSALSGISPTVSNGC